MACMRASSSERLCSACWRARVTSSVTVSAASWRTRSSAWLSVCAASSLTRASSAASDSRASASNSARRLRFGALPRRLRLHLGHLRQALLRGLGLGLSCQLGLALDAVERLGNRLFGLGADAGELRRHRLAGFRFGGFSRLRDRPLP